MATPSSAHVPDGPLPTLHSQPPCVICLSGGEECKESTHRLLALSMSKAHGGNERRYWRVCSQGCGHPDKHRAVNWPTELIEEAKATYAQSYGAVSFSALPKVKQEGFEGVGLCPRQAVVPPHLTPLQMWWAGARSEADRERAGSSGGSCGCPTCSGWQELLIEEQRQKLQGEAKKAALKQAKEDEKAASAEAKRAKATAASKRKTEQELEASRKKATAEARKHGTSSEGQMKSAAEQAIYYEPGALGEGTQAPQGASIPHGRPGGKAPAANQQARMEAVYLQAGRFLLYLT